MSASMACGVGGGGMFGAYGSYEQLEFFGDAVLLLLAVVTVMARLPRHSVRSLSPAKELLVKNATLYPRAVALGLPQLMLHYPFDYGSNTPTALAQQRPSLISRKEQAGVALRFGQGIR